MASFTHDDNERKTFVQAGGTVVRMGGAAADAAPKSALQPLPQQAAPAPAPAPVPTSSASASAPPPSMTGIHRRSTGGGRQIDDFFNEIKNRQDSKTTAPLSATASSTGLAQTAATAASTTASAALGLGDGGKGSYPDGDPTTTNIYVGNLHPSVTEENLFDMFGRYGEINSVKVHLLLYVNPFSAPIQPPI